MTAKGHHIGAADEKNFEFGLECILDHAGRLIGRGRQEAGEGRTQGDQGFRPAYAQQGRRTLVISA